MPYLGTWFASFKERDVALGGWLNFDRPNSFWMTGFSNPQGFLTSMKQVVTRQHKAALWALDDVDYHCEVQMETDGSQIKAPPKEGVFIHGLFIDGARWDKGQQSLAESEPKKLFAPMPVISVTVMTKELIKAKRQEAYGGDDKLYDSPCYRYPLRNDRYRVFQVSIPTKQAPPEHWILRGGAFAATIMPPLLLLLLPPAPCAPAAPPFSRLFTPAHTHTHTSRAPFHFATCSGAAAAHQLERERERDNGGIYSHDSFLLPLLPSSASAIAWHE
jgi:hypothetical protein